MIPRNLKYTERHEWAQKEGNEILIGITDCAQDELGDITYVELPQKGDKISQGKEFATVESVKAASDIYAPVSGEVIKVNETLADEPGKINESPYEEGWLIRVRISEPAELDGLLDADAYKKLIEEN
ncbi:glycine cleavage system protein GcvH [bacterium]|nr:glycine cleavage system protein GcvH [bacterium]